MSCVVSPGFDFEDWEMEGAEELKKKFPGREAGEVIDRLASAIVTRGQPGISSNGKQ